MRFDARRLSLVLALGLLPLSAGIAQTSSPGGGGKRLGRPSAAALTSALGKQDAMRRPNGPRSVTLSADEMASLVHAGMQPQARQALDSVSVSLDPGRLTLHGQLITAAWGPELFGPLASMFEPREPITVSGPARAAAPGLLAWQPDSFMVRNFMLPQGAIPVLVRRLTGASDGAIPIAVPPTVARIRIESGAVTFSRR